MPKLQPPKFTRQTLPFILKVSRQRHPTWLERNREEYEKALLLPLQNLARHLKSELAPVATGYHFPQKGIGRLKRPANRVGEYGGGLYKDWVSYSAARPRVSRFDHNPNLFLLLSPTDPKDPVLVAGGLYMPSSRQLRSIREAIARDASAFERLFASKEFARCFPGGFSDEKSATRPPRGFDPDHPKMKWLKLQAFFVWKPYSKKEFTSAKFPELLARDCRQIVRLNELLDKAISGRWVTSREPAEPKGLATRLGDIQAPAREMDF